MACRWFHETTEFHRPRRELWAVQCMCDRVSTSNLTQISNVTYRQIVTIHCHILQMHLHSLVLDREHVSVIPALHVPLSTLHDPSTSGANGCGSLLPSYPCSWCCQYRQWYSSYARSASDGGFWSGWQNRSRTGWRRSCSPTDVDYSNQNTYDSSHWWFLAQELVTGK